MKSFLILVSILSSLPLFAEDPTSSLPKLTVQYELNNACEYSIETVSEIASSLSLKDFMSELTDPSINFTSSDKNRVKHFSVTDNGNGSFEQKIKATKNGLSTVILNTCRFTKVTDELVSYSCSLKDSDVLIKNVTSITCSNLTSNVKRCIFLTKGKAKNMLLKGSCRLSAGGASETVNGIFRLSQFISHGYVDSELWVRPGALFYKKAADYGDLQKRTFKYYQVIQ